jgi:TPR repeat protein
LFPNDVALTHNESEISGFRGLAEQGNAKAQAQLGLRYLTGNGVTKDYAQAMKWYRLAADQGYAVAQNDLGAIYEDGKNPAKDFAESMKWFRKAAEQGCSGAVQSCAYVP